MRSSPLLGISGLSTLVVLLASLVDVASAFKNYTANALKFSTFSGFENHGWFQCVPDNTYHVIQSTTTLGATVSTTFKGTAVYLLALVDQDRGVLNIAVDGGSPSEVAGSFSNRECRYIYSKTGLDYANHTISVSVLRANAGGNTKFELAAFIYTAPETADLATMVPTSSSTSLPPNSNADPSRGNSNNSSAATGLDGGGIAGVVIGCLAIVAIAAAALIYYFHRQQANKTAAAPRAPGHPGSPAMSQQAGPGARGFAPAVYGSRSPGILPGSPPGGLSPNRLTVAPGLAGTGAYQGEQYTPPSQLVRPIPGYPATYSAERF